MEPTGSLAAGTEAPTAAIRRRNICTSFTLSFLCDFNGTLSQGSDHLVSLSLSWQQPPRPTLLLLRIGTQTLGVQEQRQAAPLRPTILGDVLSNLGDSDIDRRDAAMLAALYRVEGG